jgi:xanthosine utilization system XapX-like protein
VRSLLLAVAAFVMIGVWYAVLKLPAAALCTVARGEGCM